MFWVEHGTLCDWRDKRKDGWSPRRGSGCRIVLRAKEGRVRWEPGAVFSSHHLLGSSSLKLTCCQAQRHMSIFSAPTKQGQVHLWVLGQSVLCSKFCSFLLIFSSASYIRKFCFLSKPRTEEKLMLMWRFFWPCRDATTPLLLRCALC